MLQQLSVLLDQLLLACERVSCLFPPINPRSKRRSDPKKGRDDHSLRENSHWQSICIRAQLVLEVSLRAEGPVLRNEGEFIRIVKLLKSIRLY